VQSKVEASQLSILGLHGHGLKAKAKGGDSFEVDMLVNHAIKLLIFFQNTKVSWQATCKPMWRY
jgi:hypothetical protein